MAIQFMHIRIPDHSKVFVFGSILAAAKPNDLDLLILYDEEKCSAKDIYNSHSELFQLLERSLGLPVHVTALTLKEESEVKFLSKVNAIRLDFDSGPLFERLKLKDI